MAKTVQREGRGAAVVCYYRCLYFLGKFRTRVRFRVRIAYLLAPPLSIFVPSPFAYLFELGLKDLFSVPRAQSPVCTHSRRQSKYCSNNRCFDLNITVQGYTQIRKGPR